MPGSFGRPKMEKSLRAPAPRCGSPRAALPSAPADWRTSASPGVTPAPALLNVAARAFASGMCREPVMASARSAMKRLTMRSSSEWNVTTASRPPGFSARSAASNALASSPSSSLTKMRSAWKTRVAGWILSFGARPNVSRWRRRGRCARTGAFRDGSRSCGRCGRHDAPRQGTRRCEQGRRP